MVGRDTGEGGQRLRGKRGSKVAADREREAEQERAR